MKQLKKDLQAIIKEIKKLSQKTDGILKQVERLEKEQAVKESKAKKPKKVPQIDPVLARIMRGKIGPTDIIFAHILGSRDGIDLATLLEETGFNYYTIRQTIFRLKQQGKIKSKRKKGLRGADYGAGKSRTLYLEA